MKIGDKVRMIHDTIEGVVIRVLDDKQVEIEDTFGFNFPVLKKDLLIVNAIENQYFKRGNSTLDKPADGQKPSRNLGFFELAIVPESQNFGVYILNQTNATSFVAVYAFDNQKYELLDHAVLQANSKLRVAFVPLSKLDSWKSIFIMLHDCVSTSIQPLSKEYSVGIKSSKIISAQDSIEQLSAKGYVKTLTNEPEANTKTDIKTIFGNTSTEKNDAKYTVIKPEDTIDLHAEALGIDLKLSNSEILRKQLAYFKHNLDAAIVNKMPTIIFIHGLGSGVLKDAIHKSLQDFAEVKYFEDAQKSKFGYGATKIVLR